MAKTTTILVANHELTGKPKDGKPFTLAAGEELTDAAQKKLGLAKDDVDTLVDRGAVREVEARAAEGSSGN